MNINELKQQINRVIGVKGDLRIQAWWMNKLLSDILVYCDENSTTTDISDVKTFLLNELKKIETTLANTIDKSENDLTEMINKSENDLSERINKSENDLSERIKLLENNELPANLVSITYSELKSLRDNGKLVPGQQYRIIDYTTTSAQENTLPAGHQFDIIVTADTANVLNENARVIQHEGDTYFENSNLAAWNIRYSFDNDIERFAWADNTNGKGVIYYMKDEWNNECPYDFKNIRFARWELAKPIVYMNETEVTDSQIKYAIGDLKKGLYCIDPSTNSFIYGPYTVTYSFKSFTYCYTFGDSKDYSIDCSSNNNIIKEYINDNKITLNNIVFLGASYYNAFGNCCSNSTFGNDCTHNSFGDNCDYITFGHSCRSNTLGNSSGDITLGNYCRNNVFNYSCYSNTFCDWCVGNIVGISCGNNVFFSGCNSNKFSNECDSNIFSQDCVSNTFGNNCFFNKFGYHCHQNTFGNWCAENAFGDYCHDNTFGNFCCSNSFGESKDNLKSYYCYIIFDNGNRYINLNCTSETYGSKYFQNVRVGLGVNNTSTYKTIEDSNVGQTFETLYKPENSQTLTI